MAESKQYPHPVYWTVVDSESGVHYFEDKYRAERFSRSEKAWTGCDCQIFPPEGDE